MKFLNYFIDLFYGKREVTTTKIILFTSLFFVLFGNLTFFQNVLLVYPLSLQPVCSSNDQRAGVGPR